jgi:release factor glutamine methyltransferase
MTSVHARIAEARRVLMRTGLSPDDAALDAEVLARYALGWDRARLLADGRDDEPEGFAERFHAFIERRSRREPVAFITGIREFWGLEFEVSRDVLIPRPETELIVEAVCERCPDRGRVRRIVDVGTGSGCLAVALAREFNQARVTAIDVSFPALSIARRNATRHGIVDRLSLVKGSLLESIGGFADVIVSNPPYVPSKARLEPDITQYEPAVALYSGEDGLSALDALIGSARAHLSDIGLFVVEFGFGQENSVKALAARAGWPSVSIKDDLQGIPRVAVLTM